jgi:hypothetical protein
VAHVRAARQYLISHGAVAADMATAPCGHREPSTFDTSGSRLQKGDPALMPTLRGSGARDQRKEAVPAPSERRPLSGQTGLILRYAPIAAVADAGLSHTVQHNLAQAVLAELGLDQEATNAKSEARS